MCHYGNYTGFKHPHTTSVHYFNNVSPIDEIDALSRKHDIEYILASYPHYVRAADVDYIRDINKLQLTSLKQKFLRGIINILFTCKKCVPVSWFWTKQSLITQQQFHEYCDV